MILRPASMADIPALTVFSRLSFSAAFAHLYRPEDLKAFYAEYKTEQRYAQKLADPGVLVQLALDGSDLLGYCLIERGCSFDQRPHPHPERPVILSQLYCDPAATGRGIGAALMDWALQESRDWQADEMQLSVYSENYGAQRFYQRHGFTKLADIDFWVGNHRDDEFLYGLRLK